MDKKQWKTVAISAATLLLLFLLVIWVFRDHYQEILRNIQAVSIRELLLLLGMGLAYQMLESAVCFAMFQDIPQLVETIINEDADRVIQEHPSIESVEDCLNAAIRFALENRKTVLHIYHSINRDIYEQYQWRVCEHAVTTYVDGILAGRTVAEPDRNLMIDYLKCMCFGFVVGWLETGMQEGIQSRFHRICELKRGDLDAMITRCEKK
uniref:Transcriptional regulator TetR C-terminal Firmicutes type domain-containing protein n=1 Tax=uncultured prokaryote TaxID=198431 RepID=A0A0H5Q1U4_9ZZZZ|nr:hypothetical protein [uncultured prokaryote]